MQIVIEIPNIVKTRCDGGGILQTIDIIKLKNAVAHGTPLPEHHGRLIDTNVLVEGMEDDYEFCEAVNATPTIIPATKEGDGE